MKRENLEITNTYVGNVMHGVPGITKWIFEKLHKIKVFLSKEEIERQFQNVSDEVKERVFWTVSFGTYRVDENKYRIPNGRSSGLAKKYDFSDENQRKSFFEGTNDFAFNVDKQEKEKRYAILGTENPGVFANELRENAALFDGVKYGAYRRIRLDSMEAQKNMQPIVDICIENEWPMLIHTSVFDYRNNEGLEGIKMLAEKNPEMNFCASHMGGDITKWGDEGYEKYLKNRIEWMNDLSEIPDNFYLNTAVKDLKLVKDLLREIPELIDHILLASDVPFAFKTLEAFNLAVAEVFTPEEIEVFNQNARKYSKTPEKIIEAPDKIMIKKDLETLIKLGVVRTLFEGNEEERKPFDILEINLQRLPEEEKLKNSKAADMLSAHPFLASLARMREVSFREMKEGTGKSFDFDMDIDMHWRHLISWDDKNSDIIFALRAKLGTERKIDEKEYNAELFGEMSQEFIKRCVFEGVELGRTTFNPDAIRGKDRSVLAAMWQSLSEGIQAWQEEYSELETLWGGVSASSEIPEEMRKALLYVAQKRCPASQMFETENLIGDTEEDLVITEDEKLALNKKYPFPEGEEVKQYTRHLKNIKRDMIAIGIDPNLFPNLIRTYPSLFKANGGFAFIKAVNNPARGIKAPTTEMLIAAALGEREMRSV